MCRRFPQGDRTASAEFNRTACLGDLSMIEKQRKNKKQKRKTGSLPVAYQWLAAGTLAIYTVCGCKIVSASPFQRPADTSPRPAARTQNFEIPGGPLSAAMDAFHSATGLQITFAVDGIETLP